MSDDMIWGIDLGTTNSEIALVNSATSEPEVKQNPDGNYTTPSVVAFYREADGVEVAVGEGPKQNLAADAEVICPWVKRNMGDPDFRFLDMRAEQVSAEILKYLVSYAHAIDGIDMPDAPRVVITVPAYFGAAQKKATEDAGEIAGLKVEHLVHEPVAAAVAYSQARGKPKEDLLVYDLGGGTLDVTLVTSEAERAQCHGSFGRRDLGGKDWDQKLIEMVVEKFQEEHGVALDEVDDQIIKMKLHEEAERAKHSLSSHPTAKVTMLIDNKGLKIEVTQEEFEARTAGLLEQSIDETKKALEHAEELELNVSRLLLVGGSTRMPAVARRLEKEFEYKPEIHDPDFAIAKGAAVIGDLIRRELVFVDQTGLADDSKMSASAIGFVTPRSIGLGLLEDPSDNSSYYVQEIIPANSKIPAKDKRNVSTIKANQVLWNLEIFESREIYSKKPNENDRLHEEPLKLPPGLPSDAPLEVMTALDSKGVVHLHIREPNSGEQWEVDVHREGQMTQQDKEEAKQVAASH